MAGGDLLAIAPAHTPHFIQVGAVPVFRGTGPGDLMCRCGASVLIEGYLPGNFLGIRIQCFRCGTITATPGLPEGEILPLAVRGVAAVQTPAVTTSSVGRGDILVCQDALDQDYVLTRPRSPPDEPFVLTRGLLEAAAADYDRLTGGRLAEQTAASPPAEGVEQGPFPFAWSMQRLTARIDQPGWGWLYQDDDAIATMYVVALHHLMECWGRHPLLARLARPLAERDRFIRTVTGLATAKLLFDAGNRVGFSPAGPDVELHFTTPADEPLSLALLAPEALQWRQKHRRSIEVFRQTVIEAMAAAQGRVNRSRPGILVLGVSILQPDFDQMVVDAIQAAFHDVGRRYRGVAAIGVVMPKVLPAGPADRVGFGYAFYPVRNPRFSGADLIQLDTKRSSSAPA
jgi:hypothetical protein